MKRMKKRRTSSLLILAVVIIFLPSASWAQSPEKSRTVLYTKTGFGTNISESVLTLDGEPEHRLVQFYRIDTGEVSDPDFAIVREEVYGQVESRSGQTRYSGYSTFVMGTGDKIFLRWEGGETELTSRTGDNPVTDAGTWQVLSGTGKYSQIRGKGTFRVFEKGPLREENVLEVTF